MNLGLQNKTAIVLAASKGLGRASAAALAAEGVNVTIVLVTNKHWSRRLIRFSRKVAVMSSLYLLM